MVDAVPPRSLVFKEALLLVLTRMIAVLNVIAFLQLQNAVAVTGALVAMNAATEDPLLGVIASPIQKHVTLLVA